jgi:hypothetical protein
LMLSDIIRRTAAHCSVEKAFCDCLVCFILHINLEKVI